MNSGIIFNIQRYTINDGPGIRTEIFMKGCPLRCKWCSNPESQKLAIEPGVYPSKCISASKCGLCIKTCNNQALQFTYDESDDRLVTKAEVLVGINREICTGCMSCADECPTEAIKSWGKRMSIEDVMRVIEADRSYYEKSGGGVTISGGDPLVQHEFTRELLKACKNTGIHTCLESTFHGEWDVIADMVRYADLIISDIKHMDSAIHRKYTSVGNELILHNLRKLAESGKYMIMRIPVIPGVNDDMKNMRDTAEYIEKNIGQKLVTLQLLSFMRMGEEKCTSLGRPYEMKDLEFDRDKFQAKVEEIAAYFNDKGIRCIVGTNE